MIFAFIQNLGYRIEINCIQFFKRGKQHGILLLLKTSASVIRISEIMFVTMFKYVLTTVVLLIDQNF